MKSFLAGILALVVVQNLWAESYSADLFEQGSNRQKKLFTLDVKLTQEGGLSNYNAVFKDLSGQVVVEQNSVLKGVELIKDEVQQKQLGQVGKVEVKDGRVHFTKIVNGKEETASEKFEAPLVSSSNFTKFVNSQFDQIKEGKTVSMRYAVWARKETVGFSLKKISESGDGDRKVIEIKMSPSSFIIRQLVKPVMFKFNFDGSRILEMDGRVQPLLKSGDKYKDLDAEVLYRY